MNYWFTSDYHFFHKNIIKYENRPFKSVEEMNETIIKKHNERVKDGDIVYFLGDYAFYASKAKQFRGEGMPIRAENILKKLKGKFQMIRGNHDKSTNKINIPNYRIILNKGGIYINLIHRPQDTVIYDYSYYYPLTLAGHVHSKWQTKEIEKDGKIGLIVNVSIENNNYYPFKFDEILTIYHRWLNSHPRKKEIKRLIEQSKHRPIFVQPKEK